MFISNYNKKQLEQFFVGLVDGDGSIVVDQLRGSYRRIRVLVSLKLHVKNIDMLTMMKDNIGGTIVLSKSYVTLLISSKKDIANLIRIFDKYPFLTSRKICQWNFALKYGNNLDKKPIDFINLRSLKYTDQENIIKENSIFYSHSMPSYFLCWLSGFIEAEGCFSICYYKTGGIRKQQFSIGQNNDKYLLELIKLVFNSFHIITKDKNSKKDHYQISIGGLKSRLLILNHFQQYPLLGEKFVSYNNWKKTFDLNKFSY